MTRFETVQERSKLTLKAQSSLHPITTTTNKLEGFFEAQVSEPKRFNLTSAPQGHLDVYVDDLKSDFTYIDRFVQSKLDTRRYPIIKTTLVELRDQGDGRYTAVGEIHFHGITRRMEGEMTIMWLDEEMIEIRGEILVDVRDYNVEPPKLISITVEPELTVTLRYVLKRAGTT